MEKLLRAENIVKDYGNGPVIDHLSIDLDKGEVLVLIGPSGCGKSTFLRCLNGLEQIQGGEIYLDNEQLNKPSTDWAKVRQKIGMVFQSYELFPHMSVIDNITLGPRKVLGVKKEDAEKEAIELLARVGLADKKDFYPRELSGGQKQRVAIVRSLIMHPEVMLFDEVTAALDPEMVREVLDVVLQLAKSGMTMIIVTHEMDFAEAVCDRVIFLEGGHIVESGDKTFFKSPKTERAHQFLNTFTFKDVKGEE